MLLVSSPPTSPPEIPWLLCNCNSVGLTSPAFARSISRGTKLKGIIKEAVHGISGGVVGELETIKDSFKKGQL